MRDALLTSHKAIDHVDSSVGIEGGREDLMYQLQRHTRRSMLTVPGQVSRTRLRSMSAVKHTAGAPGHLRTYRAQKRRLRLYPRYLNKISVNDPRIMILEGNAYYLTQLSEFL